MAREQEGLSPRTIEDYKWALELHLLPFFAQLRLSEITAREIDRYKTAKASEGVLCPAYAETGRVSDAKREAQANYARR